MAWDDGVPWAIGGGSKLQAEMLRLVAWMNLGGNEGVFSSTDLEVKPLSVPGTGIRVMPGACGILNRALNASKEAYLARLFAQDLVDINPTGAGVGRSDLIIARIENPYISGEPWNLPEPEDRDDGPYVFTRVIEGVPSNTKTVAELGLGYSAIPLARVDIPASTGTIIPAYLTDLRTVVNPFTGGVQGPGSGGGTTNPPPDGSLGISDTDPIPFPFSSPWQLTIPPQATHADITVTITGIKVVGGTRTGVWHLDITGIGASSDKPFTWVEGRNSFVFSLPDYPIPAALRGTTVAAKLLGRSTGSGTGTASGDLSTQIVCKADFKQKPETTA